jgi:hypothetical protein
MNKKLLKTIITEYGKTIQEEGKLEDMEYSLEEFDGTMAAMMIAELKAIRFELNKLNTNLSNEK